MSLFIHEHKKSMYPNSSGTRCNPLVISTHHCDNPCEDSLTHLSIVQYLGIAILALAGMSLSQYGHADAISNLIAQKSATTSQSTTNRHSQPLFEDHTPYAAANSHGLNLAGSNRFHQSYATAPNIKQQHIDVLYFGEQTASPAGRRVLKIGREMALERREIVTGSCWDYLNMVFNRAGVARDTIFKGSYPNGPFTNTNSIREGDWLYYVNQSYNNVEHSGVFVGWVDRQQHKALILSYPGENRNEPGRYRVYDISRTYNVIRPS